MIEDINQFFFSPINSYININDNTINALKRLAIITLRDLLFYRPVSYQIKLIAPNLSRLRAGWLIQSEVIIKEIQMPTSKVQPLKILVSNESGSAVLIFFNKIPAFIFARLQIGSKHTIKGKVQIFSGLPQIIHPEFIFNDNYIGAIEPFYSLTYGIINTQLYSYIRRAIILLENLLKEIWHNIPDQSENPNSFVNKYINDLLADIKILHFYQISANDNNINDLYKGCLRRLAERELFANQLSLHYIRAQIQAKAGHSFPKATSLQKKVINNLEFKLTVDQKTTIAEIEKDQLSSKEMMRLLQGDVGSGKTIVALLTMLNVVASKFQAALMVPTDLLANQHYQVFIAVLKDTGVKIALLTSKLSSKDQKKLC